MYFTRIRYILRRVERVTGADYKFLQNRIRQKGEEKDEGSGVPRLRGRETPLADIQKLIPR